MTNDDVRLSRLKEAEVRKPRYYTLTFPACTESPASGIAVSVRQAAIHNRLTPIDMDLSHGEHLLITGDNGAGKSTLLNWIVEGQPPTGVEATGSLSRDPSIACVPQRIPREEDPEFGNGIWQRGIGALGKGIVHPSMWATPISDLSAGNQRRAQIAVALSCNPSTLIMDEPTNYLDEDTMEALDTALSAWKGTLIVASHDRWLIEHWHGRRIHLQPVSRA